MTTDAPRTASAAVRATGAPRPSARDAVRFLDAVQTLQRAGVCRYLECGPSGVLTATRFPVSVIPYPTRMPATSSR